jgi:AbrB family looped-hinge helix DNA binding protein
MAKVRVNYDGWLALPAAVRQKLGLVTGDRLELELAGDIITLRPRRSGGVDRQAAELPATTAEPAAPAPPPAAAASSIVKRAPGRPGKSALPVIPPTLKARGAKRKAAAALA